MKRFGRLILNDSLDAPSSRLSLLDGNCGQHRQWLTISIDKISRVAQGKNFGMLRSNVCATRTLPAPVGSTLSEFSMGAAFAW
jgi:hypothetical protein